MASEVMNERYTRIAERFDGQNALALGRAYCAARVILDEISAEKAEAEAVKDFLELKLAEVMDNEGMPKFTVKIDDPSDPDGIVRRIHIKEEIQVSATQESGAAARVLDILKDTGNGGLIKETVAPATLKKFIGDLRKKDNGGMPDPVLMQMIEAGVSVTARNKACFY
jgi:hypothetical protein